jgi:hypothetical protein
MALAVEISWRLDFVAEMGEADILEIDRGLKLVLGLSDDGIC